MSIGAFILHREKIMPCYCVTNISARPPVHYYFFVILYILSMAAFVDGDATARVYPICAVFVRVDVDLHGWLD